MNSPALIKVMLVEDNALMRRGTAAVIGTQSDMSVVGEAADGPAALKAYRSLRPDVVLLDLRLPGMDGAQVAAQLQDETPPARILVLTQYEGDESVLRALKAGALGYVTKDLDLDELLLAIRTVAGGKRYLPGNIAAKLAERVTRPDLSLRDLQLLVRLQKGMSNRDIAGELSLTERTVAVYVSNLLAKMNVKTRQEAAASALRQGIIDAQ